MRELKDELSRFSDDFAALNSAKSALEAEIAELSEKNLESGSKIR